MVKRNIIFFLLAILFVGCSEQIPTKKDNNFDLDIFVKHEDNFLSEMPVTITTNDYYFNPQTDTTDMQGFVSFADLPYAKYQVRTNGKINVPSEDDSTVFNYANIEGDSTFFPDDTNILQTIMSNLNPGIKINELYTGGPVNNIFYFYDQYIELYNSSSETLYLDGMIICRMGKYLENITYIFQFPGEPMGGTQNYPIEPGEFKVIAQDAIDHKGLVFGGEVSVDLSNADFEFRNSNDYGDQDNPDVPNLENLEVGHRLDFFLGVTMDVVVLADGSDLDYLDGLDLETVIDGVEYASKSDHIKDIENAVDRGFGGVGQVKYMGTSIERKTPGYDTNNSTLNFEIIDHPTVGYHHE